MEPKKKNYTTIKIIVGVFIALYVFSLFIPESSLEPNYSNSSATEKSPAEILADSLRADTMKIESLKELRASIPKHDWEQYTDELSGPVKGVQQMRKWKMQLWANEDSANPAIAAAAKALEKPIRSAQIKAFPILRAAYGEHLKSALWENDIDVKISGERRDRIKLIGAYFAANRNIKEAQTNFIPAMRTLRFYQSRYQWYDGQSEYTYYDIVPRGKDGVFDDNDLEK